MCVEMLNMVDLEFVVKEEVASRSTNILPQILIFQG